MATPGQRRPGAEKCFLALTSILNETAGLLKADVDFALLHGRNEQGGLLLLPGAGRAAVNGLGRARLRLMSLGPNGRLPCPSGVLAKQSLPVTRPMGRWHRENERRTA